RVILRMRRTWARLDADPARSPRPLRSGPPGAPRRRPNPRRRRAYGAVLGPTTPPHRPNPRRRRAPGAVLAPTTPARRPNPRRRRAPGALLAPTTPARRPSLLRSSALDDVRPDLAPATPRRTSLEHRPPRRQNPLRRRPRSAALGPMRQPRPSGHLAL